MNDVTRGSTIDLGREGKPALEVTVTRNHGPAQMLSVKNDEGEEGVIAIQPSGTWWWITKIDEREDWQQSLPRANAWRGE